MHCEKIKKKHVMDNIFYSNDVQRTSFNEKPLKPSLFIFTDNEANLRYTIYSPWFWWSFFLSLYSNSCMYNSIIIVFQYLCISQFIIVFQYLYISQFIIVFLIFVHITIYHCFFLIFVHITVISIVFQYLSICTYHKLSLYFNICTYHSV